MVTINLVSITLSDVLYSTKKRNPNILNILVLDHLTGNVYKGGTYRKVIIKHSVPLKFSPIITFFERIPRKINSTQKVACGLMNVKQQVLCYDRRTRASPVYTFSVPSRKIVL